jgi:hypothetical protein
MSDRINGFSVVLKNDLKDEDFEYVKNAVLMIKGVLNVKENVANVQDWIIRERLNSEYKEKILNLYKGF